MKPGIFQGNGDLGAKVLDHLKSPGGEGSLNQVVFQVNDAAQGGLMSDRRAQDGFGTFPFNIVIPGKPFLPGGVV